MPSFAKHHANFWECDDKQGICLQDACSSQMTLPTSKKGQQESVINI